MYQEFDKKIDELLSVMTLKEKIGQLNQPSSPKLQDLEYVKQQIRRGEIGSFLMADSATAGNDAQSNIDVDMYHELQRIAVEESPHGIPIIFGRDVIHGHRTVLPIPLAMASSFNYDLIECCYSDIAEEASAECVHWTFTPMLDLSRDPRWGRIIEGPGEDPYIGACMAKAVVKGVQGEDVSEAGKIVACAKHFIGYGAAEGGRDCHRTEISNYSLYNYYLPAFRAAVDAGVGTFMSSFNDINGQPVTSSRFYLTEILRDKLKFEGFVVSDYAALQYMLHHGVATNDADCSRLALKAGVDMDMWDTCYLRELESLLDKGEISIEDIDTAVRRVLRIKFAKGLFEHPYNQVKDFDRSEHLKNAREIAAESMVLLKNKNNLLPLKKSVKVALIGPFATERRALLGSWTLDGRASETPNLLEAMRKAVYPNGGVNINDELGGLYDNTNQTIAKLDVIVLALGESEKVTGEARSVSNISIAEDQIALIKKAKASGKKVVGVFFCGRPIAMQGIAENLDAILYAWHSGSEAANAVCDILFGDTVPSGKLPVTFPRLATHIPLYYNVTSSGRMVNCYYNEFPENCYVDSVPTPYYPFGYGLSYTKFLYGNITCDRQKISLHELENGENIKFSIDVKNDGDYDGKEVVELYIRDPIATLMRPLRELKAFKKVLIKKGENCNVGFQLGFKDLGFYDNEGNYVIEKGEIQVYIGDNCLTENMISIEII